MKERHVNIPLFIPHMGCPHTCVFCNQRAISGHSSFDSASIDAEIEAVLSTVRPSDRCEIAFFGGSFTGIDRGLMIELLTKARSYIDRGLVESIRLSTRPDYIDDEILTILRSFGVRTVELGLQSFSDRVLTASMRGHTAECGRRACALVKAYGFDLIGQMMIGLPASDGESERMTAETICALGADGARVYPTVVFRDTELARMSESGVYLPLSEEDAVARSADVLEILDSHGVPCIRVGLCASENLTDPDTAIGGANQSAIGELAMGEVFYRRICRALDQIPMPRESVTVWVPRGAVSKAVGQNRKNKLKICEKYGLKRLKVLEKNEIIGYNIILE